MACETHCCVFTRGEFFISDWQSSCVGGLSEIVCESVPKAYKKLGNVSSGLVEITSEILGKDNKYNPMDSTCARTLITGVGLTITLNCASKENLYRALFGEMPEIDSGRHVKDFCFDVLSECDFFPFEKLQASEVDLDVTLMDSNGDPVSTLVVDVDYRFTKSGVEIIRDGIDTTGAVKLRIAYDYDTAGYYEIDFGKNIQGYKSIYFRGTNYDSTGEALFDAVFHKVLFPPVSSFDLITRDEFLTLTLVGSVEEDQGSWFKVTKQET